MPRPRKTAPVLVPNGSKYCFRCGTVLPLDSFAADNSRWDCKRPDCRACDSAASSQRQKVRRAYLRAMTGMSVTGSNLPTLPAAL